MPTNAMRVGLLRNRSGDHALLDPIERFLVGIHRHHNLSSHVIAIEHARHFFAGLRFQTNECVDLVTLFSDNLGRRIKGDSGIALNIDDPRDLDVRSATKASLYPRRRSCRFDWSGMVKTTTLPLPFSSCAKRCPPVNPAW